MNTITWFNYDDTDADVFKIYRSIPGIQFLFSSLVTSSPSFRFSATSSEVQEILLDTSNIDNLVLSLNQGRGITSRKTQDGLSVQIRLTAKKDARLKIFKCGFAEDLGIPAGTLFVPQLSFSLIATEPYVDQVLPYEYEDVDGTEFDSYRISSVKSGVETHPSYTQQPLIPGVDYCIAEARFIDIQGRPVHGVEMTAEPAVLDTSGLTANKITVKSDKLGRVALPLCQRQEYVLHIPAIGYNQFISVPEADFIDITKWAASTKPELNP